MSRQRRRIATCSGIPPLRGANQALNAIVFLYKQVLRIELGYKQLVIRETKGQKDRVTMLPETIIEPLMKHIENVKKLHTKDLKRRFGPVDLPRALDKKYPNAHKEFAWQ